MAQFEDKIDLVGLESNLRFKAGESLSITLYFHVTGNPNTPLDVTGSVINAAIYETETPANQTPFVPDYTDAANGNIVIDIDNTTGLSEQVNYRYEIWKVDGTINTFIREGDVVIEDAILV